MLTEEQFSYLAKKYMDTVFRLALHYTKSRSESDDITQEVLLKLYRTDKPFESEDHVRHWLIRVTVNECKRTFLSPWKRTEQIEDYAEQLAFKTPEHSELFHAVMGCRRNTVCRSSCIITRATPARRSPNSLAFPTRPSAPDCGAGGNSSKPIFRRRTTMFDENLYQETISALHASEDTLSEVMNMTHKTKRRGRLRTTAVLAAVIAILCCMAVAAAALGLDQRLAEYFGATAEQEELLATAAVPMNIVKRDSGAVLRIEQVIADRYCAAVLIDFTAPEGTILDQDYYAFDRSVSATSRDGVKMDTYGIGWEVLPSSTEDETGRHAAILMTIHSLKGEFNFIGAKVKLTLDGLYRDNWGEELVVPGRWSCTFTLPETDPGRLCTVNEPIEIEGKNAVLTTLYVSPLSLTCEIKQGTDDLKETVEPIYSDDGKESIAPEVTLQNGETVGAADWLFLITNYVDERGRYCFRMDEILDPETVSSVSAFGETFSVE